MSQVFPIAKREFLGYFRSPVAYVFLVIFLLASLGLCFFVGNFFKAGQASLESYFLFHPWLFIFFSSAAGMRLWAEEKRNGTIELLFTLPLSPFEAVLGKFLAAWAFFSIAILLSLPLVGTVAYLGSPDWGVMVTSYLGSLLMAGSFLGLSSLCSALTKNQVVSFVLSVFLSLVLVFLGWSVFNELLGAFLPQIAVDALANFSFTTHFEAFTKGIVDPKDLLFFLSLAAFALFLNVVALEQKARGKTLAIALLFAGLVLINYLAAALPFRFDATSEQIYTLSPGTKSLLSKIEDPIALEFYFSKDAKGVPISYKNYAARVHEMLRQYTRAARGKLTLSVINPRPDTPEEERASAVGIQPQMLPTGEQIHFGLIAVQADQQKAITSFNPQREAFLEYDLSQLLHSVQQVDKKKLGLLSSLPLRAAPDYMAMQRGRMPENQFILSEWERTYEIVTVETTATELPSSLDVLAVVHPQNLTPKLQYAIDQFLLSGKPVFLALDPASQHFKRQAGQMAMYGGPQQGVSSDLPELLKAWGLEFQSSSVVGDPLHATKVQTGPGQVSSYPIWLSLERKNLNSKSLATAQLSTLLFVEAGSLAKAKDSALTFTPLIETSAEAGELASMALQFAQPDQIGRQLKASGVKTLAALVTGKFKSAFPKGLPQDPAAAKDAKEKPAEAPATAPQGLLESATQSSLLLVADTDWLLDDYSVRRFNFLGTQAAEPFNDNLYFGANALEFLGGSEDLVSIRGKGNSQRPFVLVQQLEAAAQKRYQDQLAGVENKLSEVQRKLTELQGKKGELRSLVASPEIQKALDDFQKQESAARRERREIRRALREDIDRLQTSLIITNMLSTPLVVLIAGLWLLRRRRT